MERKNVNLSNFAIVATLLISVLFAGCEPQIPENTRYYSFTIQVDDSAITNATVSVQTENKWYSEVTNNNGKCEILIPNEVNLPEFLIVTVNHNSIRPRAFSVSGAVDSEVHKMIPCSKAPSRVLVEEVNLHHLGNDLYGGAANSQHQLPTEGVQKSYNFQLSNIPSTMPKFQIYARGIQHPTKIKINGTRVSSLGNSASNGDLDRYDFHLNGISNSLLRLGNNVLTIETGDSDNSSDPWDDIEFCSMLLYYP